MDVFINNSKSDIQKFSSLFSKDIISEDGKAIDIRIRLFDIESISLDIVTEQHSILVNIGVDAITRVIGSMKDSGIIIFSANSHIADIINPLLHVIDPDRILLVGTRSITIDESEFIKKHRIKCYSMRKFSFEGIEETCNALMSASRNMRSALYYIDCNILDPVFTYDHAHKVIGSDFYPGGFTTRELLYLLQRMKLVKNMRVAAISDVTESEMSQKIMVKLIYELS